MCDGVVRVKYGQQGRGRLSMSYLDGFSIDAQ